MKEIFFSSFHMTHLLMFCKVYLLLCSKLEKQFITKRSCISSLEFCYLFCLRIKKERFLLENLMKTCLRIVGERQTLTDPKGTASAHIGPSFL